jgi:hypothetical protein
MHGIALLWQIPPMLLTLHIDRLAPASYRAVLTYGGVEVTARETIHSSISDAIVKTARWVPPELAQFIEPRFGGVTCGTLRVNEAAELAYAEKAAARIASLLADLHLAAEAEDARRRFLTA